jgi:site-specific DNA recombinase
MKATIYCRVSTDNQEREGTSLQTQLEACLAKAQQLGYEVPEEYIFPETWTGGELDRPLLNELRNLIRQHLIDCVISFSVDRLSRNPVHICIIAEECDKKGIELVFVSEPLDSTPEGALIRYVRGYAALVEREKIRERTLRGKREKARQGKLSTGGARLFGYDAVDGRRIINPDEALLVRQVYEMFTDKGYTLYRAVAELNRANIPAPRGGKWSEHSVHRLITNPSYKGVTFVFRYQATEPKHPKVELRRYKKTTHIFRDKSEWIELPNDVTPSIVTEHTWELAQQQLRQNRLKSPRNGKHQYLLGNARLRCGVCGRTMVGCSKKKPSGDWLFYRCISNVKSNYYDKCPQPSIAASTIEPFVWNEITKILKNPQLVIQELNRQRGGGRATTEAEQILAENQLKSITKEEQRYLRQYGRGIIDDKMLSTEIDRLRKETEITTAELLSLKERQKAFLEADTQLENVSQVLNTLVQRLDNADFELKKLAISALDLQIGLTGKSIVINGSIPSELSDTNLRVCAKQFTNGIPFSIPVMAGVL